MIPSCLLLREECTVMTYKNIAVIVGHSLMEYHGNLLEGIITQAKKLGYNVLVFSLFSVSDEITPHQKGEENIYRLINFNEIAGIVFLDNSIWANLMRSRVYEYIMQNFTGPVICANSNDPKQCLNQCIDEFKTFSNMTEHLITCHGKKKIYCLTGFKGNELAENRLAAYRGGVPLLLLRLIAPLLRTNSSMCKSKALLYCL